MPAVDRTERIEAAALNLLLTKGYAATSMLAVAKAAKTSNQTMYRSYANKQALFAALVTRNANRVAATINKLQQNEPDTKKLFAALGIALLQMLLSDEAIVLNRAAVGDVMDTHKLGAELAQNGRNVIAPKLQEICACYLLAETKKTPNSKITQDFTATYIDVLVGDLQIRRATGAIPKLTSAQIEARATRAFDIMQKLSRTAHSDEQ